MAVLDSIDLQQLPDRKATKEDMTFEVDFNDVAAAPDPPTNRPFRTQKDVDDYLAANSATTFKHLMGVWGALPAFIGHQITINVAAGVQRPSENPDYSTQYVWDFSNRVLTDGGNVDVYGAPASEWTEIIAAETITAVQEESNDPYVQVAGTPFPVDGSLKGMFAELSNGVVGVIHDNTADTLYLLQRINPVPVPASDTVRVVRPSTVVRNSLDDVAKVKTSGIVNVTSPIGTSSGGISLYNMSFETMDNGDWDVRASSSRITLQWCLFDHQGMFDTFGFTGWRAIQAQVTTDVVTVVLANVSIIGGLALNDAVPISVFGRAYSVGGFLLGTAVYLKDCEEYIYADDRSSLVFYNSVLENVGRSDVASVGLFSGAGIRSQHFTTGFYSGKRPTLRGDAIAVPGIWFDRDTYVPTDGFSVAFWFEGFSAPCIVLSNGANVNMTFATDGFKDGGGNTDIGIKVEGSQNTLILDSGTDVAGSGGEIEIEGVLGGYASLPPATAPLVTQNLNVISKG